MKNKYLPKQFNPKAHQKADRSVRRMYAAGIFLFAAALALTWAGFPGTAETAQAVEGCPVVSELPATGK